MSRTNWLFAVASAALALFGSVAAHAANPAPAPTPVPKTSAPVPPPPPVDASIARITELTRQLKVAELQKQLREANAVTTPIPVQGGNAPAPIPSIAVAPKGTLFGGFGTAGPVQGQPPAPVQPSIQSISSIGGKFTAITTEGRPLSIDSQMVLADALWKVTNIYSYGVAFERCIKNKCTPVTVSLGR